MPNSRFIIAKPVKVGEPIAKCGVDTNRFLQFRKRRPQRLRVRFQHPRQRLDSVNTLANARAVVAGRQLRPGVPQMRSRAAKLGSGQIGERARQGLALCIRANWNDRVAIKNGIRSTACLESIFNLDFQFVGLRRMTEDPLHKPEDSQVIPRHEDRFKYFRPVFAARPKLISRLKAAGYVPIIQQLYKRTPQLPKAWDDCVVYHRKREPLMEDTPKPSA